MPGIQYPITENKCHTSEITVKQVGHGPKIADDCMWYAYEITDKHGIFLKRPTLMSRYAYFT